MGLLDDAIREHLELKRRRGADPTELERQEHEALGPARQREFAKPEGEAPAADAPPEAPPLEEEEPAPPDEDAPAAPFEDVPAAPVAEAPAVDEPPPPVEEPPPPPAAARPAESEPWFDEPDEVPVDEALEHPTAPPDPDVVAPDPEPAGDDVLEETPDFLQETPEHDRLWFEQKPPRDFDFDK
jgi:hypothetical protein